MLQKRNRLFLLIPYSRAIKKTHKNKLSLVTEVDEPKTSFFSETKKVKQLHSETLKLKT